MAETIQKTPVGDLIGAVFEDRESAQKAALEITDHNIRDITVHEPLGKNEDGAESLRRLTLLGVNRDKAHRLLEQLLQGKTLVTVNHVLPEQRAVVIDTFNRYGAHLNPDGSRNLREDVIGMTTGTAIGAAAGAVVGGIAAGPAGAAAGGAAGALAGGAAGAAAGKAAEHQD